MSAGRARWFSVQAEVPARLEDELAAALGITGLGVEVVALGNERSLVKAFFSVPEAAALAEASTARALRSHEIDPAGCGLRREPVEDGRWVERYQESLTPFPLGERFVVVPGGQDPPQGGRVPLVLVPGMAFGTGEHQTTRLCAAALEREVRPGGRWLDLGCGTAVLSLVAVHCGAAEVFAVDVDPEAAGVAREVVLANGLQGVISVHCGSLDAAGIRPFDGVVANIASSFFLRNAAAVAAAIRPEGRLVASGFLEDDIPEIEDALAAAGLLSFRRDLDLPWAALTAERRPR